MQAGSDLGNLEQEQRIADGMERTNQNGEKLWAALVCNVLAGWSNETQRGRPFMKDSEVRLLLNTPPGSDSVSGVPGPDLSHDELVISQEDEAMPAFLVVYRVARLQTLLAAAGAARSDE
jgi:hypothetical protein